MATAKQLDDITECPICTEVCTDPRILPCGHTYCLKCIEAWSNDKRTGDKMVCPLCRKESTLPSNGVSDLPKNIFVSKFLQMKELSDDVGSKKSLCEACTYSCGEESESEVQNVASVYCVECQLKLCRICERGHKAMKVTRSHKLVEIGDNTNIEYLRKSLLPSYCDQHMDERLKIYCLDCKSVICMMCYVKSHSGHECSDMNEIADEFREQMTSDVDNVAAGVDNCKQMLQKLEKEKIDFSEQIAKTGAEISEKAEQLKQIIDDHKDRLMNKLASMRDTRMKEIESLREEIERQLLSMESYKKYVDEVRQKGTACDVATAASGLHNRADELLIDCSTIERALAELGQADVTFTSSHFVVNDVNKTIGQLHLSSAKTGKPISLHVPFICCSIGLL